MSVSIPPVLQEARHRLGTVALLLGLVFSAFVMLQVVLRVAGSDERFAIGDVIMALLSFGLLALVRSPRVSYSAVTYAGFTFLIVACALISLGNIRSVFAEHGHVPGINFGSLLIVALPLIVPSRPRQTAVAAVLAAAMAPGAVFVLSLLLKHQFAPNDYLQVTVVPAVAAGVAVFGSRLVHGITEQAERARRLGAYVLTSKLGEGGMGVVYRAEHAMLRRPTAVKLLPPGKAGERTITRFEKEVQQTARLTHPNTVTVFDYGRTPEGVFYYAMELLDGATLREIVETDGPQPEARVAHVLEQTACALAEAHDVGLIHRDIKPANIMLVKQGGELDVSKVLDFGLVKELGREVDLALTQADSITGTPHYLSPEGITQQDAVDARSDLYALGAVGYYLLTGDHVFSGNNTVEVLGKHLHAEPKPPSERLGRPLSEDLETLIMRCLAKDPGERPQSASELALGLRACRDFGSWTVADANGWWDEYGGVFHARHEAAEKVAAPETLDIDLARRVDP